MHYQYFGGNMATKYSIMLCADERAWLEDITRKGKNNATTILKARALLLCDSGEYGPKWTVQSISEALGLSAGTINNLKKSVVLNGIEDTLERKQRETPPREIQYDGAFEAHVIALACSDPPEGFQRWTVRLLAEKLVELNVVSAASHMSVHRALKKTQFSLIERNAGKFHQRAVPPL